MPVNKIRTYFGLRSLASLVILKCVLCDLIVEESVEDYMYIGINTDMSCFNNNDCYAYTPNINIALEKNSSFVHYATCKNGNCTCAPDCLSKSLSRAKVEFYYCGPCGRVGSECNGSCLSTIASCKNGYCECMDNGVFYEMYYCYVPYYGYEIALQMAISTCIIIALCILVASIYNAVGIRRFREMQGIRHLFGSDGVRESPPDDIPPKYDDVVEDLPSYQDALKMCEKTGRNFAEGIDNPGFEPDGTAKPSNSSSPPENSIIRDQLSSVEAPAYQDVLRSSGTTEGNTSEDGSRCNIYSNADNRNYSNSETSEDSSIIRSIENNEVELKDCRLKISPDNNIEYKNTLISDQEYKQITKNNEDITCTFPAHSSTIMEGEEESFRAQPINTPAKTSLVSKNHSASKCQSGPKDQLKEIEMKNLSKKQMPNTTVHQLPRLDEDRSESESPEVPMEDESRV